MTITSCIRLTGRFIHHYCEPDFLRGADMSDGKIVSPRMFAMCRVGSSDERKYLMSTTEYALGNSSRELTRLIHQAEIIRPVTERLLKQSGIGAGSRVLDVGCGAGDLTMLAAEIVGPSGSVVGIDQSAQAIARAKCRVLEKDLQNIDFEVSSVEAYSSAGQFDAVVGRYILIHQPIPAEFIKMATRHVRSGGVIAFHEVSCNRGFRSYPSSPLFEKVDRLIKRGAAIGFPSSDIAGRLVELFLQSGLSHPHVFAEIPVGGGSDSPHYRWMAETLHSLLPLLSARVRDIDDDLSIADLEDRLRAEAVAMRAQVELPIQVCAWVSL